MRLYYKILSILFIVIAISGCTNEEKHSKEEHGQAETEEEHNENEVALSAEQYQTAGIETGLITERSLSGTIIVNGLLDLPPQSKVSVSTPFPGILKSTKMLQGMKVRKGDLIAVLQHPDYIETQQSYLEISSQLSYQKEEFDRQQTLAKAEVNAKKSLQKASSDYQILQAKQQALKSKLKLMNVNIANLENGNLVNSINLYSPINGYITEVNTNIGAMISPSDVLFEIADTEHLHAELTVYEKDIQKIKIGQKVRFTLANEQKERLATVYLIGREIGAERTVHVHCHLDQEDSQLLPGMYLTALVESGAKKVPSLPNDAIVSFEGSKYIFIAEGEQQTNQKEYHFEMVKVNPGVSELGFTEINLDEIKDKKKSKIVLKGAYDLLSQLKNTEDEGGGHHH